MDVTFQLDTGGLIHYAIVQQQVSKCDTAGGAALRWVCKAPQTHSVAAESLGLNAGLNARLVLLSLSWCTSGFHPPGQHVRILAKHTAGPPAAAGRQRHQLLACRRCGSGHHQRGAWATALCLPHRQRRRPQPLCLRICQPVRAARALPWAAVRRFTPGASSRYNLCGASQAQEHYPCLPLALLPELRICDRRCFCARLVAQVSVGRW